MPACLTGRGAILPLVTEYGTVFGELTDSASYKGLFKYLLNHLNDSILRGESLVVAGEGKDKNSLHLNFKNLGFRSEPEYLKGLKVPVADYIATQTNLNSGDSGAAIANWIKTGKAHYYEEYLKKHIKNVNEIAVSFRGLVKGSDECVVLS